MLVPGKHAIEEQLFDEDDAGDERPVESVREADDTANIQEFDSEEESGKGTIGFSNR